MGGEKEYVEEEEEDEEEEDEEEKEKEEEKKRKKRKRKERRGKEKKKEKEKEKEEEEQLLSKFRKRFGASNMVVEPCKAEAQKCRSGRTVSNLPLRKRCK